MYTSAWYTLGRTHVSYFLSFLQAKRDATAQRVREKMDKLFREWEKQAERLEIRAGSEFKPRPDGMPSLHSGASPMIHEALLGTPPDTIDDLLCAMEDALATPQPYECPQDIVSRTSRAEAGWLAQAMREKLANDRANMADEIEKELQARCFPSSFDQTWLTRPLAVSRPSARPEKCAASASSSSKTRRRAGGRSSSARR